MIVINQTFDALIGNLYDLWNQNYVIVENDGNAKYFTRITLGACDNPTL